MTKKPVTMQLDKKLYEAFKIYWRTKGTMVQSRVETLIQRDLINEGIIPLEKHD